MKTQRIMVTLLVVIVFMATLTSCKEKTTEPIIQSVAAPTFSPAAGTYTSAQSVTITCSTRHALIRYTIDGSDPTENSNLFNSPVNVNSDTTIKARAYLSGMNPSSIASASYAMAVTAPTFTPGTGTYNNVQNVAITCETPEAVIRYTTDGSDPTENSAVYGSPVNVYRISTLKARAYLSGLHPSSISSATYTLVSPAPYFVPTAGDYSETQSVAIMCINLNATIRYTTDGSEPTEMSTVYANPIVVGSTTTIKARAYLNGWNPSIVSTVTYVIFIRVAGGTFNNGTSDVTISTFYIDPHELTQAGYQAVMGTNPSHFGIHYQRPVEKVSWFNAIEYCNRRSILEGFTPCYSYGTFGTNPSSWPSGWNSNSANHTNVSCNWNTNGYRLPTEMEWMYAARGGSQSQGYTYCGCNNIGDVAWYGANSANHTWDCACLDDNELGVFDMSGNVWEWCWDIYGEYPGGTQNNPTGASSGSFRVGRGGCWNFADTETCTVSYRSYSNPTHEFNYIGFRCVRRY